jgi:hypothetical protein
MADSPTARIMSPEDRTTLENIRALCDLADANFPADCEIVLTVSGATASGSVRMKTYRLLAVLQELPDGR